MRQNSEMCLVSKTPVYGLKKEKLGFNLFPYPLNTSKSLWLFMFSGGLQVV